MAVGASSKNHWQQRSKVLDGFHTPRIAVETFLKAEDIQENVWEPAAGFHRIVVPLQDFGHRVYTSDIFRWTPKTRTAIDFLKCRRLPKQFRDGCDILTNPPFRQAQAFAEHALKLLHKGDKVALLLRLQFLEGNRRYDELFRRYPPRRVYVYAFRLPRMHRFGYKGMKGGSTMAFAWFVWVKGYRGPTEIKWIPRP
jgi:hypothetical protein